jgi:AcrR family transcriptional regulator
MAMTVPHLPPTGSVRRIIDSAVRCFGRQGYDGASMNAISKDADVSKSLLHYHFQSKEELYIHVVLSTCQGFLRRLEKLALRDDQSGKRLEMILDEVLAFIERDLDQMAVVLELRGIVTKKPALAAQFTDFHGEVVTMIVMALHRVLGDFVDTLFIPAERLARLLIVQFNGTVAGLVFAGSEHEKEKVREAYRDMGQLLTRAVLREN